MPVGRLLARRASWPTRSGKIAERRREGSVSLAYARQLDVAAELAVART